MKAAIDLLTTRALELRKAIWTLEARDMAQDCSFRSPEIADAAAAMAAERDQMELAMMRIDPTGEAFEAYYAAALAVPTIARAADLPDSFKQGGAA